MTALQDSHFSPEDIAKIQAALDQPLRPRELQVLEGITQGKKSAEIAAGLSVSLATIKGDIGSLYIKLRVG